MEKSSLYSLHQHQSTKCDRRHSVTHLQLTGALPPSTMLSIPRKARPAESSGLAHLGGKWRPEGPPTFFTKGEWWLSVAPNGTPRSR